MSWLKVVGGALAGVGAIVALPIAGPVGAITATGAAIAAGVGAAAGAISGEDDNEYKDELVKERANNKRNVDTVDDFQECANKALSLFAVGMAAAKADGYICKKEQEAIEVFCNGLRKDNYPESVINSFDEIREQKPSLTTALKIMEEKDPNPEIDVYIELINLVIHANDKVHDKEVAFLEAFKQKVA
ncbi:tellurite resistance TerB family protein [Thalassotalea agariperforans]